MDRQEQLDEIDEILRDMDTNLIMLKEQMPDNDLVPPIPPSSSYIQTARLDPSAMVMRTVSPSATAI